MTNAEHEKIHQTIFKKKKPSIFWVVEDEMVGAQTAAELRGDRLITYILMSLLSLGSHVESIQLDNEFAYYDFGARHYVKD